MKHLGDITKMNGAEIPPVDVITGGSPCQDLSVAGKRAGLSGERSGLFIEQIRVIKEMREHDRNTGRPDGFLRPRFMVWENVPGAFSSNGGHDFAAVLEETIKIVEPQAPSVPVPDKGWPTSGCLHDELGRWSVAWRVHDAQFWGVPQRRKRIALVADFGGLAAPEVLFERKGLRGDFAESGTTRKETARAAGDGTKSENNCLNGWDCQSKRIFSPEGACATLNSGDREGGNIAPSVFCLQGNGIDRADAAGCNGKGERENMSYTLNTIDRPTVAAFSAGQGERAGSIGWQEETAPSLKAVPSGTNMVPSVYDARGNGDGQTVCALTGSHQRNVTDYTALCLGNGQLNQISMSEQANTLDTMHDQQCVMVAAVDCRNGYENNELSGTIQAKENGGQSLNYINPVRCANVVRRLTPLECERLQGYPDGWTNIDDWTDRWGKRHKAADSLRYKALGNSIALPFWKWLLKRISAQYEHDATLGSLFDGIGGFPYLWEQINGKGSALWASEIEEFCIAVTKARIG